MPDEPGAFDLDEAIRDSHARMRRHDQLTNQRHVLTDLREAVQERIAGYEREFAAEKKDVDRLERGGFARLIADLAGGRQTKLAAELVEAEAAWLKLEGERSRLVRLDTDLAELNAELAALGDARERYDYAVKRKAGVLAAGGDPRGTRLSDLHERYLAVDMDLREYGEAQQAGMVAGGVIMRMYEHLGHAAGHSRTDVVGDLVPIFPYVDYYKHQHLGAADELAWEGQRALDALGRELADIGVRASVQLPKVSTRWFADLFIDSIVFDWVRHKRIKESLEEVDEIVRWLADMVRWLQQRCGELTAARDALTGERDHLLTDG